MCAHTHTHAYVCVDNIKNHKIMCGEELGGGSSVCMSVFKFLHQEGFLRKCELHFPSKLACAVLSLQCSKSCGEGGYQHRQVKCQSHTGEVLADTLCSAVERPSEHNKCDLPHCPINSTSSSQIPLAKEYQWRAGMWSKVSF